MNDKLPYTQSLLGCVVDLTHPSFFFPFTAKRLNWRLASFSLKKEIT